MFEQPIPLGLPEQTPIVFCRERIPEKGVTGGDVGATGDAEGATGKAVGTADSSVGLNVGATGAVVGAMGVSVGMVDTSGTGLTVGESVVWTVGCIVGSGVESDIGSALGILEGEGLEPTVGEAVGSGVDALELIEGEELAAVGGGEVDILWIIRSSSSQNSEISSISISSLASESLSLALELPSRLTCNSRFSGILFRIPTNNPSALHHLGKSTRRKNASRIACLIIMLLMASTRTNEDDEDREIQRETVIAGM